MPHCSLTNHGSQNVSGSGLEENPYSLGHDGKKLSRTDATIAALPLLPRPKKARSAKRPCKNPDTFTFMGILGLRVLGLAVQHCS